MDRVLVSQDVLASELIIARDAALEAARTAGNLDENGNPIMPPNVVAGDTLVPKKVKNSIICSVYALNRAGLNYARLCEGYHNGTEVEPIPVMWGKAPADVAVVLPMAQQNVQVVNSHITYTVQLSKVGLVVFSNLIGREMQLYGRIMQNISKVDDKCACRLRSERTVTERMLRRELFNSPRPKR